MADFETLDLTALVGGHYKLLAALADKDAERVAEATAALEDEVEEAEVACEVMDGVYEAVSGDMRHVEDALRRRGGQAADVQKKIDALQRRVDLHRIGEEDVAKYDALLEDLQDGHSAAELEAEIARVRKLQAKESVAHPGDDDLATLKVQLSQLYDMAAIAASRCQYVLQDDGDSGERAAKRAKTGETKKKDEKPSRSTPSPPPKGSAVKKEEGGRGTPSPVPK